MSNLGDRLKALRASKGLKQDELADILNLSRPSISNIETRNAATKEVLGKIAAYFSVTEDWLLNGIGENPEGVVIKIKDNQISPWRDEAYEVLKRENQRLWLLVEKLSGAPVGSFLQPLTKKVRASKGKLIYMRPAGAQVGGYAARA